MTSLADAGARQAALLLHTLIETDRQWLLDRLSASARSEAERLLAELATLGMPTDPRMLDQMLAGRAGAPVPAAASSRQRLYAATAVEVADLLQGEPDALVARLLRAGDWPWRDGVLERLGPTRRRCIEELLAGVAVATGPVGESLAEALAARLERQGRRAAAVSAPEARSLFRWGRR